MTPREPAGEGGAAGDVSGVDVRGTISPFQIADSARKLICQPKHTGDDGSSIPALGWCRMIGGLWVGVILSDHHARAA
jgi:hypothetical protein